MSEAGIKINDTEPTCLVCGADVDWIDCWNCQDGYSYHDCGEDCCCCLDPVPNVECNICDGNAGWLGCTARCWECEAAK